MKTAFVAILLFSLSCVACNSRGQIAGQRPIQRQNNTAPNNISTSGTRINKPYLQSSPDKNIWGLGKGAMICYYSNAPETGPTKWTIERGNGREEFLLYDIQPQQIVIDRDICDIYVWNDQTVSLQFEEVSNSLLINLNKGPSSKTICLDDKIFKSSISNLDEQFFDKCTSHIVTLVGINDDVVVVSYEILLPDSDDGFSFWIIIQDSRLEIISFYHLMDNESLEDLMKDPIYRDLVVQ